MASKISLFCAGGYGSYESYAPRRRNLVDLQGADFAMPTTDGSPSRKLCGECGERRGSARWPDVRIAFALPLTPTAELAPRQGLA